MLNAKWRCPGPLAITSLTGIGDEVADRVAKQRIESCFPGRDVHVVEMLSSWYHGGGVHCHTNDQPAI